MSEHQMTELTWVGNVRYATLPKIEVPERFAGTPGVGSSLKNYMMQIRNAQYRWMKDGLETEDFFRGLSNTVTGEAETAYGMELERMLSEPAQATGVTWDVVTQFFDTLRRHFPVQTPERVREFASFKRKAGESLLATYGRLRELVADMECRDEWRLVSKFLNSLDERVAGDVRGRVFELGPSATLEHSYDLAKKHEGSAFTKWREAVCKSKSGASQLGRPSRPENHPAGEEDETRRRAGVIGAGRKDICSGIAAGRRCAITVREKGTCAGNVRNSPRARTVAGEGIAPLTATVGDRDRQDRGTRKTWRRSSGYCKQGFGS
ncbi:unnamed protein product [Closterium sp. Yama58-4]|nr:unnamed protein product [Closterium sp. Yama58-4]